ncbi:N-acetyltransferase [Kribbella turkmenica]|uniref:N-acetyltransferase n=1 Tax=Kribbella turkmenica TaxID=2530375 RepID=A0A4V6PDC0_9ACTN|nr:GNAT family protein [Kribbella turkmenica]TDD29007.1 N-acetyltransferase [Kribbella turkmenica]
MAIVRWPVELRHGQVALRPLRAGDGTEWAAARQRNVSWLRPWDATQPPGADEGARTFRAMARDWNRQARYGRMLPFVITYGGAAGVGPRSKWPLVGQLTVSGITYGSARWANLGYWVDEQYAGRGIVPTAVAMAADHCWFTLGLHRIEVAIRPENKASLRVVEKLGFRYEGERPRFLHIDGDWRDHRIFALNVEEVGPGLVARLR